MKQRPRIYYTESQKALMWERRQKGESPADRQLEPQVLQVIQAVQTRDRDRTTIAHGAF